MVENKFITFNNETRQVTIKPDGRMAAKTYLVSFGLDDLDGRKGSTTFKVTVKAPEEEKIDDFKVEIQTPQITEQDDQEEQKNQEKENAV